MQNRAALPPLLVEAFAIVPLQVTKTLFYNLGFCDKRAFWPVPALRLFCRVIFGLSIVAYIGDVHGLHGAMDKPLNCGFVRAVAFVPAFRL